jgi:uncharacterized membrane protein (UPF0127 family)
MRGLVTVLALLVLVLAGCGAPEEESEAPETTGDVPSGAIGEEVETSELPTVTIDASGGEEVEVSVEIADTDAERQRGLMERTALDEERGMLFVFEEEQELSFWMRNTLIPLSIAYIDSDGRIVDIQDMEPLDESGHPSAEPAQYALEVNQGFFEERGVEVGDRVDLPE